MKSVTVIKTGSLKDPDPTKRGQVTVTDIPMQPLGDEDVRIKVAYCSICGSDPHLVENIFEWEVPFGLGHELSGVVMEVGPKATKKGLKPGDRVAGNFLHFCGTCYYCQNGQQQFCEHADESNNPGMSETIVWHESQVYKMPDDVDMKAACLLEPLSVAVRLTDKVDLKFGQRVAICGGGPIGLLATQAMHMSGASNLTLIEPIAERRALAEKYGADHTVDPMAVDVKQAAMELTDGLGYDVVIDCSGSTKAVYDLPYITAKGGKLIYAAMYPNDFEMPLNLYKYCFANELTITGQYVSPYAFPRAWQMFPKFDLEAFTSAVFPIDDAQKAFEAQVSGKHIKILIECNKID